MSEPIYPPFGDPAVIERTLEAERFEVTVDDDGQVSTPWGEFTVVRALRYDKAGVACIKVSLVRRSIARVCAADQMQGS